MVSFQDHRELVFGIIRIARSKILDQEHLFYGDSRAAKFSRSSRMILERSKEAWRISPLPLMERVPRNTEAAAGFGYIAAIAVIVEPFDPGPCLSRKPCRDAGEADCPRHEGAVGVHMTPIVPAFIVNFSPKHKTHRCNLCVWTWTALALEQKSQHVDTRWLNR